MFLQCSMRKELKNNYNEKNCIFCNDGHLFGEHIWPGAY